MSKTELVFIGYHKFKIKVLTTPLIDELIMVNNEMNSYIINKTIKFILNQRNEIIDDYR
jgi:hypothetical protein